MGFPRLTPAVTRLLVLLAAVFGLQIVVAAATGFDPLGYRVTVVEWFGLDVRGVLLGRVWQPLTYMLLHSVDGWGHLLSNALGLYFLGTAVEERAGTKALYKIALGSGIAGAVSVLAVQGIGLATGRWEPIPVVGASGAISGLAGVFCVMFWDRWLYLFFIRLQGRHLLALLVFIDAIRGVQGMLGTATVAVHCHLGGLVWGILWVNGWASPRRAWLGVRHWWIKRKLRVVQGGGGRSEKPRPN